MQMPPEYAVGTGNAELGRMDPEKLAEKLAYEADAIKEELGSGREELPIKEPEKLADGTMLLAGIEELATALLAGMDELATKLLAGTDELTMAEL